MRYFFGFLNQIAGGDVWHNIAFQYTDPIFSLYRKLQAYSTWSTTHCVTDPINSGRSCANVRASDPPGIDIFGMYKID